MTLARALHEAIYKMPRGQAQSLMLHATRPDWSEENLRACLTCVPEADLREAFVSLARALAGLVDVNEKLPIPGYDFHANEKGWGYPDNRTDL
jgi:hypothetical protein